MTNENGLSNIAINLTFPEETIEVCGQRLLIDEKFEKLLCNANLTISDLGECAQRICQWMKQRKWFNLNHTIIFVVDQIPHDNKQFLFGYSSATLNEIGSEAGSKSVGIIAAFSDKFEAEVAKAHLATLEYPGKDKDGMIRKMLHGSIGFCIAHELCHAFGINRQNEIFLDIRLEKLELLTDCSAFESCREFIGEDTAYLGANYIHLALKKKRVPINADSVKQLAASVIANPWEDEHLI